MHGNPITFFKLVAYFFFYSGYLSFLKSSANLDCTRFPSAIAYKRQSRARLYGMTSYLQKSHKSTMIYAVSTVGHWSSEVCLGGVFVNCKYPRPCQFLQP